ncbi:MAG: tyrosine-type recombinase/integrase [Akkermansiaceae bacterium]|nr:tyrosine-type recombinase/integrase [Akkermansiaceae bacterium]
MLRNHYEKGKDAKEYFRGRLSLNKDKKSPYWMVTFEGGDGRMKRRSTKVPVAGGMFEGVKITAKIAEKIAYQRGVQIACAEEKATDRENVSVREWCEGYLERRLSVLGKDGADGYKNAFRHLYEFLGARAERPIKEITRSDAKNYVLKRRESVRAGSVTRDLHCLVPAFNDAFDAELIMRNPFSRLPVPADKPEEKIRKEAFTLDEIRYMVETFPPEWSSAVRCSFETYGQRLGDILRLDWKQFDWERRVVRFVTHKTGRELFQPMSAGFYEWARARWKQEGEPESGLLHPHLNEQGKSASRSFGTLLRKHGIGRIQPSPGGRRCQRNSKGFHCIRSTCATLLHAAGLSQGMAMELVGHNSAAVHEVYIRPSASQLAAAAAALPALNAKNNLTEDGK